MKKATLIFLFTFITVITYSQLFNGVSPFSGDGVEEAMMIKEDANGNTYTIGRFTGTADFDPGTGTFNLTSAGQEDIFIVKIDNSGSFEWAFSFGSTLDDEGLALNIDNLGYVYLTGYFRGTVDFDPGAGTNNLTSSGGGDTFILKLSPAGVFSFVKQFASNFFSLNKGTGIMFGPSNELIIFGIYSGSSIDFDPGAGTNFQSGTNDDIYITCLSGIGNFNWFRTIQGTNTIILDEVTQRGPGGYFVLTGTFNATADFDPTAGVNNLTSPSNSAYICRISNTGSLDWVKQVDNANSYGTAIDGSNNIFIGGGLTDTIDSDPGTGVQLLYPPGGACDHYLLKLDQNGNFVWSFALGGLACDWINDVDVDALGNLYTLGKFCSATDFDPGAGTSVIGGPSNAMFIAKYSPDGKFKWVRWIDANVIAGVDLNMHVYNGINISGTFQSTVDFDPWTSVFNVTSSANHDAFNLKLDFCPAMMPVDIYPIACDSYTSPSGKYTWTTNGNRYDTILTVDGCDSILLIHLQLKENNYVSNQNKCEDYLWPVNNQTYTQSGTYTATFTNMFGCDSTYTLNLNINRPTANIVNTSCDSYFWPISGQSYSSSGTYQYIDVLSGCDSLYILNLTLNNSTSSTEVNTACDNYTWPADGNNYSASGTYQTTLQNSMGCDSVVTLNLTLNSSTSSTEVNTACDNYTWPADGNNYTASGTYQTTLQNSMGCDSVVTLNLTLNSSTSSTEINTACDNYTWPADGNNYSASGTYQTTLQNAMGCDSVVTLNLTLNSSTSSTEVNTSCFNYTWPADGNNYTASGTYQTTIQNAMGCDSVITLNLTINSVNPGVIVSGFTLVSNEFSAGTTYQWLDCNNGFAMISGETNQAFLPQNNGTFAVEVSANGCTDTSACIPVTGLSLKEDQDGQNLVVYPNPFMNRVKISIPGFTGDLKINICNAIGETVHRYSLNYHQPFDLFLEFAPGIYFAEFILPDGKRNVIKLVKEN